VLRELTRFFVILSGVLVLTIGVDLAGLMGGRMASAEGGSVPSGMGFGEGCPLLIRLGGLGSVVSSASGVRAEPRPKKGFWRILKATERSFCTYMTKSEGGTICLSVPYAKFWGICPPCHPVMYAHGSDMLTDFTS